MLNHFISSLIYALTCISMHKQYLGKINKLIEALTNLENLEDLKNFSLGKIFQLFFFLSSSFSLSFLSPFFFSSCSLSWPKFGLNNGWKHSLEFSWSCFKLMVMLYAKLSNDILPILSQMDQSLHSNCLITWTNHIKPSI